MSINNKDAITRARDILVKGDDYAIENIVGHDIVQKNGGTVKTITLVKGYSTTSIVEKIKKQIKS